MWALLGLLASINTDLAQVAINADVAKEADFRVPVSDSVRAATWDMMTFKPAHATTVRVACIVMVPNGAPGACVSASRLTPGQTVADWRKLREEEDADRSRSSADVELLGIVAARLDAARLPAKPDAKSMFALRVFEETVSATDARPAFVPGEALTLQEVTLATPLDGSLVQALFPGVAMRFSVNARVAVKCKVQPTLKLLCRDRGTMQAEPSDIGEYTHDLRQSMLFATYQLASTIKLDPKTKDGRDVIGRDLSVAIAWRMP